MVGARFLVAEWQLINEHGEKARVTHEGADCSWRYLVNSYLA